MAVATSTWIALALAAAAAGTSYYNTQQTAKKADSALATSIRNQGKKEEDAGKRVNAEVEALKNSTSAEAREKRLGEYRDTLLKGRQKQNSALEGEVGGDAFKQRAAAAVAALDNYGGESAGLMARIDAPTLQRQGEGFGYGKLATDLGLIGRESKGMAFLDELRYRRAAQRNAGLDALSAVLGGAAGGVGAGAGGAEAGTAATAGNSLYAGGYRGLGSLGY